VEILEPVRKYFKEKKEAGECLDSVRNACITR
jgi:hypothetical protein